MIVLKVAILTYYIAINIYGATLLLMQRKERTSACDNVDNNIVDNNIEIADSDDNKECSNEDKEHGSSFFEEENPREKPNELSESGDCEKADDEHCNLCNIN